MFHSSMPTLFGRPQVIVTGNETLQAIMVQLRDLNDPLVAHEMDASRDARHLLSELSAELCSYFEAEETDEYFGTLMADCPSLRVRVERLGAAHDGFRNRVGDLQQLANDESRAPELAVRIEKVLSDFEEHEQAENAVLDDFFRDDGAAESRSCGGRLLGDRHGIEDEAERDRRWDDDGGR